MKIRAVIPAQAGIHVAFAVAPEGKGNGKLDSSLRWNDEHKATGRTQ